ncbi:PREDICTED: trypsin epsilon-like [Papilio polytes]|uniref:trypsin epsilon-like n=1 Tax=Papilio polytes TaxID=76194 RepID=UPI000675C647|nr:PREDICTED: trypsin epsilon-like [Papilio polytes]
MPITSSIAVWSILIAVGTAIEKEITFSGNISVASYGNLFESAGYPNIGDIPLLNRKIFKGVRVSVQEHPYLVSVRRLLSHYLTGTLLTRKLVISVAHPLSNVPVYELGVVAGQTYSDRGTTLRSVVLVIFHEEFDPYTLNADLALLRLYEEFVFK